MTFPTPGDFLTSLEPFLAALPSGLQYAVEIRNKEYLSPAYFDRLATHNVPHVFSAWTRMPALEDQAQLTDAFTADFTVVRALLAKGRNYEEAVQTFEPYKVVQEPNEGARQGMREIIERSLKGKKAAFLFVNNRLEGNAHSTIEAVVGDILV
jgi:hypothetical protein